MIPCSASTDLAPKRAESPLPDLLWKGGDLRAGTLRCIVRHVIFKTQKADALSCLLHGYRQYCSPRDMLLEVEAVLSESTDVNLVPPAILEERLYKFLYQWMSLYYHRDFAGSAHRRTRLLGLMDRITNPEKKTQLKLLLLRAANSSTQQPSPTKEKDRSRRNSSGLLSIWNEAFRESNMQERTTRRRSESYTAGIISKHADRSSLALRPSCGPSFLLKYDCEDIASQLTVIESQLYEEIQVSEFDDNAWQNNKARHTRAPFLTAMVEFSNKVTAWAAREITEKRGTKQVDALEKAIMLSEKCHQMRNYNAFMEIHLALSTATVTRQRDAWARISAKHTAQFAQHSELLSPLNNFRNYRKEVKDVLDQGVAVLPYIGTFLRDAFFVNEANPAFVSSGDGGSKNNLINLGKIELIGNQMNYFNRFKEVKFQLKPNIEIHNLLLSLPREEGQETAPSS